MVLYSNIYSYIKCCEGVPVRALCVSPRSRPARPLPVSLNSIPYGRALHVPVMCCSSGNLFCNELHQVYRGHEDRAALLGPSPSRDVNSPAIISRLASATHTTVGCAGIKWQRSRFWAAPRSPHQIRGQCLCTGARAVRGASTRTFPCNAREGARCEGGFASDTALSSRAAPLDRLRAAAYRTGALARQAVTPTLNGLF